MDPALFFSTSAQAKSFLHFSLEVRNNIYWLAILDHDLRAVFLPNQRPEGREPGILLACEQIRRECLPIYYSINSFTWQFQLDEDEEYDDSFDRFCRWTGETVGDEHAKLITSLSFIGTHTVEEDEGEGMKFDADIDIYETSPYFTVKVKSYGGSNYTLDLIKGELKVDLVRMLQNKSSNATRRVVVTGRFIRMLGAAFRKVMERDPATMNG